MAPFSLLVALLDFGESAPHELASRLQTDRSHISSYVESLMKRGWVTRVPDAVDRRRVSVDLTAEGRSLIEQLVGQAAETEAHMLDALTSVEQETLRRLLAKVLDAADAAGPDPVG